MIKCKPKIILFLSRVDGISFSLNWEHLDCKDIIFLVEQLNQRSKIAVLNLCKDNLESDSAFELAKLQHITDLDVSYNDISSDGAITLLNNPNFKKLNLSNNYFKYNQSAILDAVTKNHTLEKLAVDRAGLSPAIKAQIDAHFEKNPSSLNGARFPFGADRTNLPPEKNMEVIIVDQNNNGLVK